MGDGALAEDILQDAFVRSVDRADTLRSDESAVAWFYRMLRNAVIDQYRRRGARERGLEALARELEGSEEPEAEASDTVCKCVSRLAGTLKPEYAEMLRLVEIEGLSVQDAGARMGISANNAGVRVHRARGAAQAAHRIVRHVCAARLLRVHLRRARRRLPVTTTLLDGIARRSGSGIRRRG